ncbi:MAG: hypothetical protein KGI97_02855 [Alphaproteobacteria bacterium]|nr:hypothetical protein [Alphaproteobacteria bacterium]
MTYSLVSASVGATASVATFNVATSHPKNETSSQAVNIGNLSEQGTIVSVSDKGTAAGSPVSTTFTAQAGDLTSLSESFGNLVDQASTRFQLYDSSGAVIADNLGTSLQQYEYSLWLGGGLNLNEDTYTAVATPQSGVAAAISTMQNQGTSLQVSSSLTGSDTSEYYNFSLSSGNNIKMAFDAGSLSSSTRVQLYDANGNLVADSRGNAYQKTNFNALTSGTGLTASAGNYSVKVTYADGADNTKPVPYSFQLYSGSTYSVVYKNKVAAQPYDNSSTGSVTADPKALLYSRTSYNVIGSGALGAVNIGWLMQDKSALALYSQLTPDDSSEFYSFTLQSGSNLKFGFDAKNSPQSSDLRVQLYDRTGTYLFADSQGTPAQRAAYTALTTQNGLSAKPGTYAVKISYANGAKTAPNLYGFYIYSGNAYSTLYKTTASAQTYGNAMLIGTAPTHYSMASATAAYLATAANGGSADVFATLATKV